MDKADICEKFFWHVRGKFRNQKQAAEYFGVTNAMISAVMNGRKPPTDKMLLDMGFCKVISYERL